MRIRAVLSFGGSFAAGIVGYVVGRQHDAVSDLLKSAPSSSTTAGSWKWLAYLGPGVGLGTFGYVVRSGRENLRNSFNSIWSVDAATVDDSAIVHIPGDVSTPAEPKSGILGSEPPSRVSEIMRFGYPGFDNLRTFEDFVVSYDRRHRTAHWVMEHLTPDRMVYNPLVDRSKCEFREDESIHTFFRSRNADYMNSGYDRGHLAAAGNHRKTQRAVDQTFLLSNMAPQIGKGFNRDKWNELEKHVRKLARANKNVYVCTGPLYLPQQGADGKLRVTFEVIGKDHVAVPTHFFKVALVETKDSRWFLESYVMPNRPIDGAAPLKSFYAPLESIERAAGFLIFHNLPRKYLVSVNGR